jgi:lipid-binding SYLF domain-containing protein
MRITHLAVSLCAAGLIMAPALRAETTQDRLRDATNVFQQIMNVPEKGIPRDLLEKSHCVVIVPSMKKGAFIVGGSYGKGFVTCRKEGGAGWTAPAAIRMEGGSVGLQIGGQVTDIVMLVMNENGKNRLLQSKFTLGGDASVAAGPVGRTVEAKTDALMTAEILTWSRSGGVFAGISLAGATLRPDQDDNAQLYGRKMTTKEALAQPAPVAAKPLLNALNQYSRHEAGSSAERAEQGTKPTEHHETHPKK